MSKQYKVFALVTGFPTFMGQGDELTSASSAAVLPLVVTSSIQLSILRQNVKIMQKMDVRNYNNK